MSNKSLYQKLVETGVEIDFHESDLYVENTTETQKIIGQHRLKNDGYPQNIQHFNGTDGKRYIEIPFGYEPFWETRLKDNQTQNTTDNEEDNLDDSPGM